MAAAAFSKLGPIPASLPSDQKMIDGWFLSRSTMLATRLTWAPSQAGSKPSCRLSRVQAGSRCPNDHIGVALDIGLVHHIEAVLVGQGVPALVIGIVRGAHGVDVVALHQPMSLAHRSFGDDVEGVGSCSWRLTPRMTIGRPLTITWPALISTVRKPIRWRRGLDHRALGVQDSTSSV
jgi:hypothetical protein